MELSEVNEKMESALQRMEAASRLGDLNEIIEETQLLIDGFGGSLDKALISADVDDAKQQIIVNEKLAHNINIAEACRTIKVSNSDTSDYLQELRRRIENSVQILLAAKKTSEKSALEHIDWDHFLKATLESNNSGSIIDWDIAIFLYNYSVISYKLNERSLCFNILVTLFDFFSKHTRGSTIDSIHSSFVVFATGFFLLDFYTVQQSGIHFDEINNGVGAENVVLKLDYQKEEAVRKCEDITQFLEIALNSLSEKVPRSDVSELKFRLHLYKSKVKCLENGVKQSRKEIKSALEILQHDLKKQNDKEEKRDLFLGLPFLLVKPIGDIDSENRALNTEALCLKANLEHMKRNHRKTVKLLQSGLKLGLSQTLFLNNMACVHQCLGQTQMGLNYLLAGVKESKICPSSDHDKSSIFFNLGLQLMNLGKYRTSMEAFDKASRDLYNKPILWLCKARCACLYVATLLEERKQKFNESNVSNLETAMANGSDSIMFLKEYYRNSFDYSAETESEETKELLSKGLTSVKTCLFLLKTFYPDCSALYFDSHTLLPNDVDVSFEACFSDVNNYNGSLPTEALQVAQEAMLTQAFLSLFVNDSLKAVMYSGAAYWMLKKEDQGISQQISHVADSYLQQETIPESDMYFIKRKMTIVHSTLCALSYACEGCLKRMPSALEEAGVYSSKCIEELDQFFKFKSKYHDLFDKTNVFEDERRILTAMARINYALAKMDNFDPKQLLALAKKSLEILPDEKNNIQVRQLRREIVKVGFVSALKGQSMERAVDIQGSGTVRV